MRKEIATPEETETFVNSLIKESRYVIDVQELPDEAGFIVEWMEHKNYTAQDGKEYPDEVWTTKENKMVLVQDLEPEHCRNVLRMMLRQQRELTKIAEEYLMKQLSGVDDDSDGDELETLMNPTHEAPPTIH